MQRYDFFLEWQNKIAFFFYEKLIVVSPKMRNFALSKFICIMKHVRVALQIVVIICLSLVFLDFTGVLQPYLGWLAKIQFLPAVLRVAPVTVLILLLATFVFGRLYCSVVCPMGILQDFFNWIGVKFRPNRFHYRRENRWLRFAVLTVFVLLLATGFGSFASLVEPYSAFGRVANNLFQPLYRWINNMAADYAAAHDSYAFYAVDNTLAPRIMFIVSSVTLVLFGIVSLLAGRWWCSNVCPVGSLLSLVSRWSLLRPVIDTSKCNGCQLCARRCKASCINPKQHRIDMSNCVVCFDCINNCRQGAIKYRVRSFRKSEVTDQSRRHFIAGAVALGSMAAVDSVAKSVDGGLAVIEQKKVPARSRRLVPAGAWSISHFAQHCTGCQLCVSNCPNQVLRPSTAVDHFMQPEMSYEQGYCRPECTRCSDVCPNGAIRPITREQKSSTQIGHAVWIAANCVVVRDGVSCGNCARHCPSGAIMMVRQDERLIPAVNAERCIGCGACENLCPSRPFSAIYVEGNSEHRTI